MNNLFQFHFCTKIRIFLEIGWENVCMHVTVCEEFRATPENAQRGRSQKFSFVSDADVIVSDGILR